jgi:hypothetical protein
VRCIERVGRADRQADAVQAERMVAAGAAQDVARQAAAAEIVFGVDLDEADVRALLEERGAVLGAQADAGAERERRPGRAVRGEAEHGGVGGGLRSEV